MDYPTLVMAGWVCLFAWFKDSLKEAWSSYEALQNWIHIADIELSVRQGAENTRIAFLSTRELSIIALACLRELGWTVNIHFGKVVPQVGTTTWRLLMLTVSRSCDLVLSLRLPRSSRLSALLNVLVFLRSFCSRVRILPDQQALVATTTWR
jgi:hypothetical protein